MASGEPELVPLEDPPEPSPEQKVLIEYVLTQGVGNVEDYMNLIAIVYGVRNSGILTLSNPKVGRLALLCANLGILVRKYPFGNPNNFIFVRGGNPATLESLKGLAQTNTPAFHTRTGELLGYFEPYNIFNANLASTKKVGIGIDIELLDSKGKPVPTRIFSQRVSSAEPYMKRLEEMAQHLRDLPPIAFAPFKVLNIKVDVKPSGGKRKVSKARRTRTNRRTRRR